MTYDLIVIGGGPGGYVAAIRGSQLGMKTLLIEEKRVGGTCLNRGCIPTKTLLHTGHLYHEMQTAAQFGIKADGITLDAEAMRTRKETVVDTLCKGVEGLLKGNRVEVVSGHAVIQSPGKVLVGETLYQGTHILLAVGGTPSLPPVPGLDLPGIMTSDQMLEEVPLCDSLIIIGGGVIGMEFASLYNDLGVPVTVIEAMDRILPTLEKEIGQNLAMLLKKRGVICYTGAQVIGVESGDNGFSCTYTAKGKEQTITASHILVATGRRPNVSELCGPDVDLGITRGGIPVNDRFETKVPGIYAIGDVVEGNIQLAHVASAQGIQVVTQLAGKVAPIALKTVPSCVYTRPEIACVGITEAQAKAEEIPVKSCKYLMSSNARTVIAGGDRSFIKVVFNPETQVVLGAQLMCERATDLIGQFTAAVVQGKTLSEMGAIIQPHPTFGEGVGEAVETGLGHAIHQLNR